MSAENETLAQTLQRARAAQLVWAEKPLSARLAPLARLRARLASEPKILAEVVAREVGKTRYEAIAAEVLPVAEVCSFLLRRAPRLLAPRRESLRGTMPFTGNAVIRRAPWGVVAMLSPWNYPLLLAAGPALHALAAGNAVVMKPSPRAKDSVAAFAGWLYDAGIPEELAPVLDSSDESGRALTASPLIDKIVFTGGSSTGRAVLAAAARNLVPATVELSGYDAVFVLRDANVELAAAAVNFGLRLNAGRTCVCPRRIFVEESVAGQFTVCLRERLKASPLLAPMDALTLSQADELAARLAALTNVASLNSRALGDAQLAVAVCGGVEALRAAEGNFVPAIVVVKVSGVEEALALNAVSSFALGASIFTRSPAAASALARRLRAGMIAINECVAPAGEAALPFGGSGESGYGVRGGEDGLLEMTRLQVLAFARGTFRPHHVAESEAEDFVLALLRARHGAGWFTRIKGWVEYAIEGRKWKPPRRFACKVQPPGDDTL